VGSKNSRSDVIRGLGGVEGGRRPGELDNTVSRRADGREGERRGGRAGR
jgi:hypothetical protein